MTGKSINNELLNYNVETLKDLENKFKSIDSVENLENINNLMITDLDDAYLIDKYTEEILKTGHSIKLKNNKFCYMVIFNVVKKKDEYVLVYNYIPYNEFLIKLLYSYIALEQIFCLFQNKKGYIASDFFFVLDEKLRKKYSYFSEFDNNIVKHQPGLLKFNSLNESLLNNY